MHRQLDALDDTDQEVRLADYLDVIARERNRRPAEAMLADEIMRLRAVLGDLGKEFAHDGDIHFHAQAVAYRREQIRKVLDHGAS